MSKYPNRTGGMPFLVLVVGLAATALTHAGQPNVDLEAEAKKALEEDELEAKNRAAGIKPQRMFFGAFHLLSDSQKDTASQKLSPDVVGLFVTDNSDRKPGRTYQVKVENGSKATLEQLKRVDGKKAQLTGKLRIFGPEGDAKYLIVATVVEVAPTPRLPERRALGGT